MTADKIKALREAKGWTQADLARKLGITRNGVNSWEQGLSTPSPACLVDLATVFSVSTDYLLGIEHSAIVDVSGLNDKDVASVGRACRPIKKPQPLRNGSDFGTVFLFAVDIIQQKLYN